MEESKMEFDKSRVYTALNADELKVGSKVIFADALEELKVNVKCNRNNYILKYIQPENSSARFYDGVYAWHLAYLVEEPEEKKLKWTDLKIGDVLRNKNEKTTAMVGQIDECVCDLHILAGCTWIADDELENWEKVNDKD
jgi:hypothetical protein